MSWKELICNHVSDDGIDKCARKAKWEVWFGPGLEDFVLACREHVGALLTDEDEHRLFRIYD